MPVISPRCNKRIRLIDPKPDRHPEHTAVHTGFGDAAFLKRVDP
ncbi:hypothetical protein RCH06_003516 [Polaromonas sp. CG_9.5]|nr:hypothetical protein [Polaromonas sp. CG_9.5]